MEGLKLCFMTSLLKSGYNKLIPYYIFALAFSIASQIIELLPIVPQKKVRTARYFGGFFP